MQDDFELAFSADEYGVSTEMRIEDDALVTKQTYDAEPLIEAAARARIATAGDKWGDGHFVGTIPMAELQAINKKYASSEERKFAVLAWLKANPKLVTFDKFLR